MKRNIFCLFLAAVFAMTVATLHANPTQKTKLKHGQKNGGETATPSALAESANGWTFLKGEWVHPEGYKFANGKVLRTTVKTGKAFPNPPGKLALENAQKLTPKNSAPPQNMQSAVEKKAEERRKNLTPTAAPQTGTHM